MILGTKVRTLSFSMPRREQLLFTESTVLIKIFSNMMRHIRIKVCGDNNLCTASWLCKAKAKSPKGYSAIDCR